MGVSFRPLGIVVAEVTAMLDLLNNLDTQCVRCVSC